MKQSAKQAIRKLIIRYFKAIRPGQKINGDMLCEYCLEESDKDFKICDDPGINRKKYKLVLRYMRELKQEKVIDYECIDVINSVYKKK